VTTALVIVIVAAVPTALVIAVAVLAHVPVVGVGFEWCAKAIGVHQAVPAWIGLPALALIGLGGVRVGRLLRQLRSLRVDHASPIHIADSSKPLTLPDRGGQIVVSTAMVELPPLRAMARRVNYSIERWADEVAAQVCGDRALVAVTLRKVALRSNPTTVAGFAGLGVAARMGALLAPPIPSLRFPHLVALWSSLAVAAAFGVYQLHHMEQLLVGLCRTDTCLPTGRSSTPRVRGPTSRRMRRPTPSCPKTTPWTSRSKRSAVEEFIARLVHNSSRPGRQSEPAQVSAASATRR
jgi:hypothetical protein